MDGDYHKHCNFFKSSVGYNFHWTLIFHMICWHLMHAYHRKSQAKYEFTCKFENLVVLYDYLLNVNT